MERNRKEQGRMEGEWEGENKLEMEEIKQEEFWDTEVPKMVINKILGSICTGAQHWVLRHSSTPYLHAEDGRHHYYKIPKKKSKFNPLNSYIN